MFEHVTIRVGDRGASERFHDTVLEALGIHRTNRGLTLTEWHDFGLGGRPRAGGRVLARRHRSRTARRRPSTFTCRSQPTATPAYLLDPDGGRIELVNHKRAGPEA